MKKIKKKIKESLQWRRNWAYVGSSCIDKLQQKRFDMDQNFKESFCIPFPSRNIAAERQFLCAPPPTNPERSFHFSFRGISAKEHFK